MVVRREIPRRYPSTRRITPRMSTVQGSFPVVQLLFLVRVFTRVIIPVMMNRMIPVSATQSRLFTMNPMIVRISQRMSKPIMVVVLVVLRFVDWVLARCGVGDDARAVVVTWIVTSIPRFSRHRVRFR